MNMTREEFQKIVDDITGGTYHRPKRKSIKNGIAATKGFYGPTQEFRIRWMTGGAWAGNCWDETEPSVYGPDPEEEPEFDDLISVLIKVAPNMGFLQYKQLMAKAQYENKTEYEYYGNYTTYAIKTLSVDDVWNTLKENGYV